MGPGAGRCHALLRGPEARLRPHLVQHQDRLSQRARGPAAQQSPPRARSREGAAANGGKCMTTSEGHKQLAAALGRIPSGLFVLTFRQGEIETGMLASW